MVLESIFNPLRAEQVPKRMFFIGLLYSTIALFLSLLIFRDHASIIFVFLTVIATVPLMYNTLKIEEKKDLTTIGNYNLLKEHGKALKFFVFLFFGFTLSFSFWYVVLPSEVVDDLFAVQTETIIGINSQTTGKAFATFDTFSSILFNNLKVLIFCVVFAFIYGAGAIFILTWNASVIGVAIGNVVRTGMSKYATSIGLVKGGAYFHVFSIAIMRYALHGIPEIVAYFIGGLAGGIISVAVIRHHITSKNFERIIFDTSELLSLSILLLIVAAAIETYISPHLF